MRWACSRRSSATWCTPRWTPTGWFRRHCARRSWTTKAAGKTIKFLYTIPNFHNPAGVTMSLPRRREVLEICREQDILVLEDNPYGLLGFDAEPMRALRADEAEGVIYLGSFSKTFSPACASAGRWPARRP